MSVKCDYCGTESEIAEAYSKVPRSFSRKFRRICPNCLATKKQAKFRRQAWYWLGTIVVGGALLFEPNSKRLGFYILNLTLFDFCLMLTILPHELGHAATAKLVGFRVFRVVVGSGKTFYKRRISEFLLELNRVPFGGFTVAAPKKSGGLRWRYALYIVGGPAVNSALAFVAYLLAPHPFWPISPHSFSDDALLFLFEKFGSHLLPLQLILVSNIYVLVFNLWPRLLRRSYGIIPSDGLALWRTAFMKEERAKELLAAYYISEANECYENRRYPEAQNWVEEGLKRYPDNEVLINFLGVALLEQMRVEDARKVFLKQMDPPPKNAIIHAFALNNLAYADVLTEDSSLLEEAEKYSALALAKLAWHPLIKGTRGAVLIEMGRMEEGIKLLREAVSGHERNEPKAVNACFLAIAERKLGHAEAADSYLKMAETLDPQCFLLARARRAI